MIGVDVLVKNRNALYRTDRVGDERDSFNLAAFAEVWYTLNEATFDF